MKNMTKATYKTAYMSTKIFLDPSGFEFIDQEARKCTFCNQPGHNSRTCQLNSN